MRLADGQRDGMAALVGVHVTGSRYDAVCTRVHERSGRSEHHLAQSCEVVARVGVNVGLARSGHLPSLTAQWYGLLYTDPLPPELQCLCQSSSGGGTLTPVTGSNAIEEAENLLDQTAETMSFLATLESRFRRVHTVDAMARIYDLLSQASSRPIPNPPW